MRAVRIFVLVEGAAFAAAASVHLGLLAHGYEHQAAGTAETVIAAVLLVGFGLTWAWPRATRGIGIGAQAFALFGTLVGIFTIAVGIGPRTPPDIGYHVGIVIVLVWGLVVAARARQVREA